MQNNKPLKPEDCFMEYHIEKMITYIKSNKLLFTITISINLCLIAFAFILWYLYGNALPELKNTDKLSAIFNFLVAISTMLLAVFGFYGMLTYKNATKQYMRNELEKLKFSQLHDHITNILNHSGDLYRNFLVLKSHYSTLIEYLKNSTDDHIIEKYIKQIKEFENNFEYDRYRTVLNSSKQFIALEHLKILGGSSSAIEKINDLLGLYLANIMTIEKSFLENKNCIKDIEYKISDRKDYILKVQVILDTCLESVKDSKTKLDEFSNVLFELNKTWIEHNIN